MIKTYLKKHRQNGKNNRPNIWKWTLGFRILEVRDKLYSSNAYFSTSSLQKLSKNKAGASCGKTHEYGLSRKLPYAPACPLFTIKKFAA